MKLVHPDFTQHIDWTEHDVLILVFEHVGDYRNYLGELYQQIHHGEKGAFTLSENDASFSLAKQAQIIVNPFDLAVTGKTTQQAIVKQLERLAQEDYQPTIDLMQHIQQYMQELCNQAFVDLAITEDISLTGLFKLCDVRVYEDGTRFIDRLMTYMQAMHRLGLSSIFCFAQLKTVLLPEELQQLYTFALQEKMTLILVESKAGERLEREKYFILDETHCELFG